MPRARVARSSRHKVIDVALVAAQALLFVGIGVWPSSWGPAAPAMRELGGAFFIVGGVGMLLAARDLGRALTPVPEPNGAGLRTAGLFRWMRHPMYTAVLIVVIGVACARGSSVVWALVAALVILFEGKTRREEAYLVEAYDGYATYAAATGKFLPGVAKRRLVTKS